MCHPISPNVADFLDHNSFIPCDKIIQWDCNAMVRLFKSNPDVILGTIPIGELEIVQYEISTATTISKNIKRKYSLLAE